jgi:hypothetical protein
MSELSRAVRVCSIKIGIASALRLEERESPSGYIRALDEVIIPLVTTIWTCTSPYLPAATMFPRIVLEVGFGIDDLVGWVLGVTDGEGDWDGSCVEELGAGSVGSL